jgi:hypothetical protein
MASKFCGRYSVAGIVAGKGLVARLGCHEWDCADCGPKRARLLKAGIVSESRRMGLTRFLTLTMSPLTCTAEESYALIKKVWAMFRTYLKRKTGVTVEYVWVLELQKSGYAHLHVLVDHYLAQRWVSRVWQTLGGGRVVDIRRADAERVGPYISKYLTKSLLTGQAKRGQRRYGASRGVCLKPPKGEGVWGLVKMGVQALRDRAKGPVTERLDARGVLVGFETETPMVPIPLTPRPVNPLTGYRPSRKRRWIEGVAEWVSPL